MAAYTFKASPPFHLTRISKEVIVHPDFYSTPKTNPISNLNVVFPAGIVVEDGWIYVSYGENDAACDCFVSAYRGEGFALTVLEAMACELPVVVTDGGATDDFVTTDFGWKIPSKVQSIGSMHGCTKLIKDGWTLEPDVDALSRQMRWIVSNPSELAAKGRAASECARKEWTWQKAAELAAARITELAKTNAVSKS